MAKREWTPSDLPADFRLFEWDFARNDLITLDSNSRIASIADTWQGRLASTASVNDRRTLGAFEGVQGAYKAGSGADTRADGIILSDLAGLPAGNDDRYLGFAAVAIDGIIGGYRGSTDKIYCFDTPFDPGLRFYYDTNRATSQLRVDKTLAHFYTGKHASSVSNLRVDGLDAGTYPVTLQTVLDRFGIAGAETDFYGIVGYSFYVIVGKRAPTQDEEWRIEAWVAKYKTKRTVPTDNPYRTALPEVDDGQPSGSTASASGTLGAVIATASAAVAIVAAGAGTLSPFGGSAATAAPITARADAVGLALSGSAAAQTSAVAGASGSMDPLTGQADVGTTERRVAEASATLPPISGQATAGLFIAGQAAGVLGTFHGVGTAGAAITARAAAGLARLSGKAVATADEARSPWLATPKVRTVTAPAQVRIAFTTRQVRLLYASKDNRMLIWPTKRVAEVLDYALDWSARIGDEAIVSSKATIRGDMVTIDRDRHDGKVQQVWLAGGVNGVGHIIMQVTTDAGRTYEEAVQLSVAV